MSLFGQVPYNNVPRLAGSSVPDPRSTFAGGDGYSGLSYGVGPQVPNMLSSGAPGAQVGVPGSGRFAKLGAFLAGQGGANLVNGAGVALGAYAAHQQGRRDDRAQREYEEEIARQRANDGAQSDQARIIMERLMAHGAVGGG
jgi:hypothetical protein